MYIYIYIYIHSHAHTELEKLVHTFTACVLHCVANDREHFGLSQSANPSGFDLVPSHCVAMAGPRTPEPVVQKAWLIFTPPSDFGSPGVDEKSGTTSRDRSRSRPKDPDRLVKATLTFDTPIKHKSSSQRASGSTEEAADKDGSGTSAKKKVAVEVKVIIE